jgi:general secretion pathway protein I
MSRRQKGFTLLEVTIAMVILASGLLLLANSWSAGFLKIRKTQFSFEVASLLDRKMAEIELKYTGKALTEIPDGPVEESFDDEAHPEYSWRLESRKLEIPDMTSTLTTQAGGASEMLIQIVKQMTEALSKSVKEVTVTVIYTKDAQKLEWSVTTYFVDFDKPLALGVPGA